MSVENKNLLILTFIFGYSKAKHIFFVPHCSIAPHLSPLEWGYQ